MHLFFLVPPLLGLPSSSPDTLSSQPDLPLDVANRPLQPQQTAGMSKDASHLFADTNVMRVDTLLSDTQTVLFSKYLCTGGSVPSDSACLEGGTTIDLSQIRVPRGVRLLVYGASFVRQLTQLVLAAHIAGAPGAPGKLQVEGGRRGHDVEKVTCWCGYGLEKCAECIDVGSWQLGESSSLTMVSNFKELQTVANKEQLQAFLKQGNFTHAWVGRVHEAAYYDRPTEMSVPLDTTPLSRMCRPRGAAPPFSPSMASIILEHFPGARLQLVEDVWDGWNGRYSRDERACRAAPFGLGVGDDRDRVIASASTTSCKVQGATHPCSAGHQCLFVCDTETIDASCRSGPLVPAAADLVAGLLTPSNSGV